MLFFGIRKLFNRRPAIKKVQISGVLVTLEEMLFRIGLSTQIRIMLLV